MSYVCTTCRREFATHAEGAGHLNPNPSWDGYRFCGGAVIKQQPDLMAALEESLSEVSRSSPSSDLTKEGTDA